jgi:MFS family permease
MNAAAQPGIPTSRTDGAPSDAPPSGSSNGSVPPTPPPPPAPPPPAADATPAHPERAATYRDVFSVRPYRHLFAASCLSYLGDQLTKVALAVLVFNRTNSPLYAALAYAISFVPWVLGGPLLSSYADLLPRRQVMVVCDIARFGLVALLAVPRMPTVALIVILFVANLFAPPFSSARAAMMPDLMEGDRYVVANGIDGLVRQGTQVAGFLIGGASVAVLHPQGALLLDAGTFVLSALLVLRGVPNVAAVTERSARFSLLRDTRGGARIVFGDPVLRAYVALFWAASALTYAYEGIAVPYARELHGGASAAGVILAVGPLGLATGSFFLTRALRPTTRMRLLMPFALLSVASLIPALVIRNLTGVAVLLFLAGAGCAFALPLNSLFVRAVPTEYRGRAFGVAQSGVQALQGLAMLLAGAAATKLSPGTVVAWSGIIGVVVVGTLAYFLWPRDDFHRGR